MERAPMTKPIPESWHSVTPRLVVHDAAMLVEFHIFPRLGRYQHAFGRVATHLRNQYTLGFMTDEGEPDKWHSLKILVEHPELKARKANIVIKARRGYYN